MWRLRVPAVWLVSASCRYLRPMTVSFGSTVCGIPIGGITNVWYSVMDAGLRYVVVISCCTVSRQSMRYYYICFIVVDLARQVKQKELVSIFIHVRGRAVRVQLLIYRPLTIQRPKQVTRHLGLGWCFPLSLLNRIPIIGTMTYHYYLIPFETACKNTQTSIQAKTAHFSQKRNLILLTQTWLWTELNQTWYQKWLASVQEWTRPNLSIHRVPTVRT